MSRTVKVWRGKGRRWRGREGKAGRRQTGTGRGEVRKMPLVPEQAFKSREHWAQQLRTHCFFRGPEFSSQPPCLAAHNHL